MDVEGFELRVLHGAERLFTQHNVWYLMLECNRGIVGGAKGQLKYFRWVRWLIPEHCTTVTC